MKALCKNKFDAAYCLAILYGRRPNEEVLAFTILIGVVMVISYFVLLFAGCVVAWLVSTVR
jgi:small neutral amino acid transporter SnatA (MarC family)